jgi:D-alanine-D-alanine ligase
MRIAFTHNLQLSDSEDEAEFDTPETVGMIADALRALHFEVEPVEVSGPASRVVARLEALLPDLVFNTAEGTRGRFREAFYPALFDRLGLPFTGSDAYVCALTLDKHLTKLVLAQHGIPSPKGVLARTVEEAMRPEWRFPVIVKPNHEGSSVGITVDSVVESSEALRQRVVTELARFPVGLLIEEFIRGVDLVVPYLEGASPKTGGVLEPASYHFDAGVTGHRAHTLYDYELKGALSHAVEVRVPAEISAGVRARAIDLSRTVFRALQVRDMGRIDFRVADTGELYFIEVNALPSLEWGASIYRSAELAGLTTEAAVLDTIVTSAAERQGLDMRPRRKRRRNARIRVGLTFNVRRQNALEGDREAEFDTPETISALRQAIESFGHDVLELEALPDLPARLATEDVDVVFNMAEGIEGRSREAQVPALLELIGIPYTASDPTALSLALDKAVAKRLVHEAGIVTPSSMTMRTGKERLPKDFRFPAIAKPVHEGSSKGISESNVVRSEEELRALIAGNTSRYRQDMLVETYLPGREFTIGLLGERRPRVLPPMEILFQEDPASFPVYSYAHKFEGRPIRFEVPAKVDPVLGRELERVARVVFHSLGCRDVARIDVRLDEEGRVNFLECNPLPGLSPGFSDLCIIGEAAGLRYRDLIGEILAPALRRMRERRRQLRVDPRRP